MDTLASYWVAAITLINIFACYWLIKWTMKVREGESAVGEVTGHKWDENLEEYNNPLPRWWLWLFYGTIIFSLVYLVLYPGLGNFKGMLGWSSTGQYQDEVKVADAKYGPIFAKFAGTPIPELARDKAAMEAGRRLFATYCTQCHGSDAGGTTHFPNLTDNDWLYGGTPEKIQETILKGRNGMMPPMGPVLGEQGVEEVAAYVMSLSGRKVDPKLAEAGKQKFVSAGCVGCHGMDAKGNQAIGAPNLTDTIWLHGSTARSIKETITKGRTGKMPAHEKFLGKDKVHLLAAYVYSLSNDK